MPESPNKILVTQKIIVLNGEEKILSIRRSKTDPTKPLSWDLPGGLVDEGENLRDGIIRELKEETGIEIASPNLVDVFDYVTESGTYLICIGYYVKIDSAEVILSYEHDMFEWITAEEFLNRDVKNHTKEVLRRFINI